MLLEDVVELGIHWNPHHRRCYWRKAQDSRFGPPTMLRLAWDPEIVGEGNLIEVCGTASRC